MNLFTGERTRVLVAIKHAGSAAAMLEHAKSLAADGAKLWVVHVLDLSLDTTPTRLMEHLEAAEAWLRNALTEARMGGSALPLVVVGTPASEIMSAVRALDADVLILGAEPSDSVLGDGGDDQSDVGTRLQADATCPVVFYDLQTNGGLATN